MGSSHEYQEVVFGTHCVVVSKVFFNILLLCPLALLNLLAGSFLPKDMVFFYLTTDFKVMLKVGDGSQNTGASTSQTGYSLTCTPCIHLEVLV